MDAADVHVHPNEERQKHGREEGTEDCRLGHVVLTVRLTSWKQEFYRTLTPVAMQRAIGCEATSMATARESMRREAPNHHAACHERLTCWTVPPALGAPAALMASRTTKSTRRLPDGAQNSGLSIPTPSI